MPICATKPNMNKNGNKSCHLNATINFNTFFWKNIREERSVHNLFFHFVVVVKGRKWQQRIFKTSYDLYAVRRFDISPFCLKRIRNFLWRSLSFHFVVTTDLCIWSDLFIKKNNNTFSRPTRSFHGAWLVLSSDQKCNSLAVTDASASYLMWHQCMSNRSLSSAHRYTDIAHHQMPNMTIFVGTFCCDATVDRYQLMFLISTTLLKFDP